MYQKITSPAGLADPSQDRYQVLEDLATAHWFSEVLFAALDLDIFTHLEPEGIAPSQLAGRTGWDREALERLLLALTELGLTVEIPGGFTNSPLAHRYLLPAGRDYLGDFLLYRRYIASHWPRLNDRIRRGPEANKRSSVETHRDYQKRVLNYVRALDAQSRLKAREAGQYLIHLLPESPRYLLDLGGGAGAWGRILRSYWPGLRTLLVDLPEVLRAAGRIYPKPDDWRSIDRVAGDILQPCLNRPCFDLVILSNIIHAYGPDEALIIFKYAASMLKPKGYLLIHDYRTDDPHGHPLKGRLYDLHMMLNTYNGRIHQLDHLRELLARSGFNIWRTMPLKTDTSLVLAKFESGETANFDPMDCLLLKTKALGFRKIKAVSPRDMVLQPWVRLKCRFGCSEYGRNRQCPPFSPDADEMCKILSEYKRTILVEGAPPGPVFHNQLLELERLCFLEGYHKALAFGAGPCLLCSPCEITRTCRYPDKARPALEACGVDVYETVRRAGWYLTPVRKPHGYVKYIGLVLVD